MKTLAEERIDWLTDLAATEHAFAAARQAQDWRECREQVLVLGSVIRHLILNEKQQTDELATR